MSFVVTPSTGEVSPRSSILEPTGCRFNGWVSADPDRSCLHTIHVDEFRVLKLMLLVITGNIGAGKSVTLNKVAKKLRAQILSETTRHGAGIVVPMMFEEDIGAMEPLLEYFYKDPKHAKTELGKSLIAIAPYGLQSTCMKQFHTVTARIGCVVERHLKDMCDNPSIPSTTFIFLTERSPLDSYYVFTQLNKERYTRDEISSILLDLQTMWKTEIWSRSIILWLSAHPSICANRILDRNRASETGQKENDETCREQWEATCRSIEKMREQYHPIHGYQRVAAEWTMHIEKDDTPEQVCAHVLRFIEGALNSNGGFWNMTSME